MQRALSRLASAALGVALLGAVPAPARADAVPVGATTVTGTRPRYTLGASFAIADIVAGSGERDGVVAGGVVAAFRPVRYGALIARYGYAHVGHDYGDVGFSTSYHRLGLAAEARVPLGLTFDFAAALGPELVFLRSNLRGTGGGGAGGDRSRTSLGLATGLGAIYRIGRIEVRADSTVARRLESFDLFFGGAALFCWR